jgi:ribonuclease HII
MLCSLEHENTLRARGFSLIAGIDEAGRGPLAGPVVAAAVILPCDYHHDVLRDSKQLTPLQRDRLYEELVARTDVFWAVAVVTHREVDKLNILRATHKAMRAAVALLNSAPDHVLIDGLPVRPFPIRQIALVDGDALSFSIAAASVIAKVTRDRLMFDFDREFPEYGFAQHKGYATELHLERLRQHGPCPIHRRTFLPVQELTLPLPLD